jgi:fluoride exporter
LSLLYRNFINAVSFNALPYGTLISNVIGSFIAGILAVFVLEKLLLSETYRLMLLVGLTGSLMTMSALSIESIEMLSGGSCSQALLNILLNIALSFGCKSWGNISKVWV